MAKELPEDLVTEILVWLPVVSLLRFKCVCKSWYALITHQNFIRKHLLHNNNNNRNALFLLKTTEDYTEDYVVSTLSYETLQVSLTQPVPPPYFGMAKKVRVYLVGSCNGLVCLHANYGLNVVIWNPATKETKVVSNSNLPRYPAGYHTVIDGIGFGFDAKTNDYKILNLLSLYDDPNSIQSKKIVQSEVYSLSADSWRKGDSPPCFLFSCLRPMDTYINGVASWNASVANWKGVLSFDMSDEVFLKTQLPDDVLNDSERHFFLLNESIAMAVTKCSEDHMWYNRGCSEVCFDIWLLLEVGVNNSWTRLFTIGPITGIFRPLGSWKNDSMFLEKCYRELVLYDPSTKEVTDLEVGDGQRVSWQIITYTETLVSVKGGHEVEE
jgi:F-box interacting protein